MAEELKISVSMPESLVGKVEFSEIYRNFNAKGTPTSFGIDIRFNELGLEKSIKSADFQALRGKIEAVLQSWATKYQKHLHTLHVEEQAAQVDELNAAAKQRLAQLRNILKHTLNVNDAIDWDSLKRVESFHIDPETLFGNKQVPEYIQFDYSGYPMKLHEVSLPKKPTLEDVAQKTPLLKRLFSKTAVQKNLEAETQKWEIDLAAAKEENRARKATFDSLRSEYEKRKSAFEEELDRNNSAIDRLREKYLQSDPAAVEEYCDLVLGNSVYPDYFPTKWNLEYRPQENMLIVDYWLPSPEKLPTTDSYRYIKSRDEIVEKALSAKARSDLFNQVAYAICIRTIHELFEADVVGAIEIVAFNGILDSISPATGLKETKAVLSVVAGREEFLAYDLSRVDPKETFRHLKGISSQNLSDLVPVAPIIQMSKQDKRFIEADAVIDNLNESMNLASMDWKDFEYLIRDIFEKEFAASGGEVHVTQASSDGGVDAIAFDPDPIRGGKIVIQAKRYTRTVGVAAVRELYGTVITEGAARGILVTTSTYGKDSYEFARGKPLTLLDGQNLLALLEKHGYTARIDTKSARKK